MPLRVSVKVLLTVLKLIVFEVNTNRSVASWAHPPRQVDVEEEAEPQSVIHAPSGFGQFVGFAREEQSGFVAYTTTVTTRWFQ